MNFQFHELQYEDFSAQFPFITPLEVIKEAFERLFMVNQLKCTTFKYNFKYNFNYIFK